jgi:hypothetical protein
VKNNPYLISGGFSASITAPKSAYFDIKCGFVALLVAASISAKARAIALASPGAACVHFVKNIFDGWFF